MTRPREKDLLVAIYAHLPREVIKAEVVWRQHDGLKGVWLLRFRWYEAGVKMLGEVFLNTARRPRWRFLTEIAETFAMDAKLLIESKRGETIE